MKLFDELLRRNSEMEKRNATMLSMIWRNSNPKLNHKKANDLPWVKLRRKALDRWLEAIRK